MGLIRLGIIQSPDATKDYFNPEKLETLELSQIVFWDETHHRCYIGDGAGRDYVFVFPRDENGNLDRNGKYKDTKLRHLKVKYSNEVRMSFGVAAVKIDGEEGHVGRRCKPFDYSGKVILSITDYEKEEIQRVQNLT